MAVTVENNNWFINEDSYCVYCGSLVVNVTCSDPEDEGTYTVMGSEEFCEHVLFIATDEDGYIYKGNQTLELPAFTGGETPNDGSILALWEAMPELDLILVAYHPDTGWDWDDYDDDDDGTQWFGNYVGITYDVMLYGVMLKDRAPT